MFCKSPYGLPNFYGLELSTMKVLRAVFLANVPMESFIFIYYVYGLQLSTMKVLKAVFCEYPYEILHVYGLQLSTMKVLKAVCWRISVKDPSFLWFSALTNDY